mgnify:FL=1
MRSFFTRGGGCVSPLFCLREMKVPVVNITLYKNTSANNTINKNIISPVNISGHLHDSTDVEFPVIVLHGIYTAYNYCYIPAFQRYYFIENIVIHGNTTIIKCTIDVLYTYRTDVLNSYALINQSTEYNPYYNGGLQAESRTTSRKYSFNNPFNSEGALVMVTAAYYNAN